MALLQEIVTRANAILVQPWTLRDGQVVPKTENVVLAGGGVLMTPTMLYADLADSTTLASAFDPRIAATVIKMFLDTACHIIRYHDGHIRSFDGDRVMGVFIGADQNDRAVKAAFQLYHAVVYVLRPAIEQMFPVLAAHGYQLKHGVGIDQSETLTVRAGVRDNNDLSWIGRAPNVAAKLSAIREEQYATYITDVVYQSLSLSTTYNAATNQVMWEPRDWIKPPFEAVRMVHRSAWTVRPPSTILF